MSDFPRKNSPLNLHLQQLAYLREVERCESWAKAAENLHISQSALSQSLAEMQKRLGVELFEKAGRRRRLTRYGMEVARFARRTLAEAEALEHRIRSRKEGESGILRVGMIDAAHLYLLPDALRTFRQRFPLVRLQLTVEPSSRLQEKLERFELDVAFLIGGGDDPGLRCEEITSEKLYIYSPPGRGKARDAEWALYPSGSHTRELIDLGMQERDIQPRVTLESGDPQVLRQMVVLNGGWSVLPRAIAERGGEGACRRRGSAVATRRLLAARRATMPDDELVESLIEQCRQ